jgi:hypothetical protein
MLRQINLDPPANPKGPMKKIAKITIAIFNNVSTVFELLSVFFGETLL